MLQNYLMITFRGLRRYPLYSAINLLGFSIGLSCALILGLYIYQEMTFDRFHTRAQSLYRVLPAYKFGDGEPSLASGAPASLAPALKESLPEVIDFTRLCSIWNGMNIRHEGQWFASIQGFFADASFFNLFDFKLIAGDPATALKEPYTIVLTKETARRIFGPEEPMGKVIQWQDADYTVTGVAQTPPWQSSLQFEALISCVTTGPHPNYQDSGWGDGSYNTYLLLRSGIDVAMIERKALTVLREQGKAGLGSVTKWVRFQPLLETHLYSGAVKGEDRIKWINWQKGDSANVQVVALIAALIMLISGVNFVNLTTARSACRAKEVGLRKVVGAARAQLIGQFMGESIVLTLLATVGALALIPLAIPALNDLEILTLRVDPSVLWTKTYLTAGVIGGALIIGGAAGSYPAWFLSAFQPMAVFRREPKWRLSHTAIRRGLIVLQFSIAILMLIGVFCVTDQTRYMHSQSLGFEKSQQVILPIQLDIDSRVIKQNLLGHPSILGAAASGWAFGSAFQTNQTFRVVGASDQIVYTLPVDEDFVRLYGLQIVEGQAFDPQNATDWTSAYLINEAFARKMGWKDPLNRKVGFYNTEFGPIIGMVKDFHIASLHSPVDPLVIYLSNNAMRDGRGGGFLGTLTVKIRTEQAADALAFLKQRWETLIPKRPFEYYFLDDNFSNWYQNEQRTGRILAVFASLAIVITCLGLLGLVSYMAERRTKEIGIRKTLGASIPNLLSMMTREFMWLALAANVVAWPIAYHFVSGWLENFAYRIDISPLPFLVAGALTLAFALIPVGFQAWRAARLNPVEALRYE